MKKESGIHRGTMRYFVTLLSIIATTHLYADSMSDALDGFDDAPVVETSADSTDMMDGFDDNNNNSANDTETKERFIEGLTGKITEQVAYSYNGNRPHDKVTSLKSSLFLDYEHKFDNSVRLKVNAKSYYDAIYDLRDEDYTSSELKAQRHEIELFDAYVEQSIDDHVDIKLGRQVVVWGRSDTIRITDMLNPIDNRRPGMVDIEDLRLPRMMGKVDIFYKNWRITPMAILEQRFSKNPAFGSSFNPMKNPHILNEKYNDVTYALSVGAEFSGWDVNFYTARLRNDAGYVKFGPQPSMVHDKINMYGTAFNILSGGWLFKTELAYLNGLKYTTTQDKTFSRTDALIGLEYKGIADTLISYDISLRHFSHYDNRLAQERIPTDKNTYQHALRVSSDFLNAMLSVNYLISLYGKSLDEGGFQRAWIKYELAEGLYTNFGFVDYIGGSKLFDSIKNNDMVFLDISYSF